MTRIVKFENSYLDVINVYLSIMQNSFDASIISVQCYGVNNDCYMVLYNSNDPIDEDDIKRCFETPVAIGE